MPTETTCPSFREADTAVSVLPTQGKWSRPGISTSLAPAILAAM